MKHPFITVITLSSILIISCTHTSCGMRVPSGRERLQSRAHTRTPHRMSGKQQTRAVRYTPPGSTDSTRPGTRQPHGSMRHNVGYSR